MKNITIDIKYVVTDDNYNEDDAWESRVEDRFSYILSKESEKLTKADRVIKLINRALKDLYQKNLGVSKNDIDIISIKFTEQEDITIL